MACNKNHLVLSDVMNSIPADQGGVGRHKCAACAYEAGYEAGAQRHKSPHAAFALGYYKGVCSRTKKDKS